MEGLKLDNGSIAVGLLDFDGNVLQAPTPHYYKNTLTGKVEEFEGHEVDQNPGKFFGETSIYKLINDDPEQSWMGYRCVNPYKGHRGFDGLLDDILSALENNMFSPSFDAFKNLFLVKGRIFSILTARGNSPDNFQRVFQLLSSEILNQSEKEEQLETIRKNYGLGEDYTDVQVLEYYFRLIVDYIPCHNPHVQKYLDLDARSGAVRKTQAMKWYIPEIHRKLQRVGEKFGKSVGDIITPESPLALGFSDDSVGNIVEMGKWMGTEGNLPKNHKGRLFFTGKSEDRGQIKDSLDGIGDPKIITQGGNEMLQIRINPLVSS